MITLKQILQVYRSHIKFNDIEYLLCALLKKKRAFLYTHPEFEISNELTEIFENNIKRLKDGEPIQYITEQAEFCDLNFYVNKNVLIPRPETELLVEYALEFKSHKKVLHVLELGTGSGAIALSIAKQQPALQIIATDISSKALLVAKKNKKLLEINNVKFIESDWFENVTGKFDIVISNPPYIAKNCEHLAKNVKQHEPESALIADDDGLQDLKHILSTTPQYTHSNSILLIEHGFLQQEILIEFANGLGYSKIEGKMDQYNNPRVISCQAP